VINRPHVSDQSLEDVLRVVADIQERASGVPQALRELGVNVETRPMWAGDYRIGEQAIVERKTTRGLHAAVVAGRFWPQMGRVRDDARFVYLLVEGADLDDGPLAIAAIRGICVALMDLGVHIVRSTDARDSALWLYRMTDRHSRFRHRNRPAYAQRPKRDAGAPAAEAALGAVPGISRVTAQALLTHFGSLAAVVQADRREWQRVPGIGPARASALAATFHTPYTAHD
jgi:DNA excision repair protein ERCC-4